SRSSDTSYKDKQKIITFESPYAFLSLFLIGHEIIFFENEARTCRRFRYLRPTMYQNRDKLANKILTIHVKKACHGRCSSCFASIMTTMAMHLQPLADPFSD